MKIKIALIFLGIFISTLSAEEKRFIVVAKDGSGNFISLTEAINSLPMFNYQRTTIFVKNGIYNEKIRIDQDYITIEGESRDSTIIQFSQLRSDWQKNKDSIGPAVINIFGDDFILRNVTVENTQPEIGPHAFAIYGTGNRTIIVNSNLKSKGADTVSLWRHKDGMYYHANCYFEGSVDFVCPRGWCYIKDSEFYEHKKTAAVWHAGGEDKNQKFVIVNSKFNGVDDFELGRHHYDAQFYFINCVFPDNMSSKEIYRVTYPNEPERDRPFNWGKRYFFYNNIFNNKKFPWIKNNIEKELANKINAEWTFDYKWNPERIDSLKIIQYKIHQNQLHLILKEKVTVINNPKLKSSNGKIFNYLSGAGSDTLIFSSNNKIEKKDLKHLKIINEGKILASQATVVKRYLSFRLK
ncbi:MAG: pectinesterase family protein [Melioribacteraceae bacterium]|nr:pectinesterase family protein [Melioribacteraceae bacterium]